MAHILKLEEQRASKSIKPAFICQVEAGRRGTTRMLWTRGEFRQTEMEVEAVALPSDVQVIGCYDKALTPPPGQAFYMSTRTMDPTHALYIADR